MFLEIINNQILISLMVFFISLFSLKIIMPFLRKICMDIPNKRSSHSIPTPTCGGIIFPIIGIPIFWLQGFYFSLICIPISLIGLWDDIYNVSPYKRLFFQILTCIALFKYSPLGNYVFDNFSFLNLILIFIIVIFLSVGLINLSNFADGIDGLLTGNMIIILFSYAVLAKVNIFPFISILLAFWFFNKSPAKVFMGDCGSNFLGTILVFLLFQTYSLDLIFSILIIGVPIFGDTCWTLLKRFVFNYPIFKPHRLHLFQRLNQAGWNHKKITILYISFTAILSTTRLFTNLQFSFFTAIIVIILALFIDKKYAKSFKD